MDALDGFGDLAVQRFRGLPHSGGGGKTKKSQISRRTLLVHQAAYVLVSKVYNLSLLFLDFYVRWYVSSRTLNNVLFSIRCALYIIAIR